MCFVVYFVGCYGVTCVVVICIVFDYCVVLSLHLWFVADCLLVCWYLLLLELVFILDCCVLFWVCLVDVYFVYWSLGGTWVLGFA